MTSSNDAIFFEFIGNGGKQIIGEVESMQCAIRNLSVAGTPCGISESNCLHWLRSYPILESNMLCLDFADCVVDGYRSGDMAYTVCDNTDVVLGAGFFNGNPLHLISYVHSFW